MPLGGGKLVMFKAINNSGTTQSLNFDFAQAGLTMARADFGAVNTRKVALSMWVNLTSIDSNDTSLFLYTTLNGDIEITLLSTGALRLRIDSATYALETSAGVVGTGAWHHIYFKYDSTQATDNDRLQIYYDGSEAAIASSSYPTLNYDISLGGTGTVKVAASAIGSADIKGLVYDWCLFSDTLPSISAVYNGGTPPNVSALSGRFAHLKVVGGVEEEDDVIATDWTNVNGVTASGTIP